MINKLLKKINNTQQIIIYISVTAFIAIAIWRIDGADTKESKPVNYNLHTEIPRGYNLYALEIDNWSNLDVSTKEQAILSILKSGSQENIKILFYKDRPFYTKTNLRIY